MSDLIARVYVAGKLVREDTLAENYEAIANQHLVLGLAAQDRGERWMVEIEDPDAGIDVRYVRFGTDCAGMVAPMAVDL